MVVEYQGELILELEARIATLESRLEQIHKLATWDEEEHDDEEPTEDDMIEALTKIYALSL